MWIGVCVSRVSRRHEHFVVVGAVLVVVVTVQKVAMVDVVMVRLDVCLAEMGWRWRETLCFYSRRSVGGDRESKQSGATRTRHTERARRQRLIGLRQGEGSKSDRASPVVGGRR